MEKKLEEFFNRYHLFLDNEISNSQKQELINGLESDYQAWFLSEVIKETEEIMAIDPDNPTKKILEFAAERMVRYLEADAATIRVFDPESMQMSSFGAYGVTDYNRLAVIPLKDSISGQVLQQKHATAVPNLMAHPFFKDKSIVKARGFHSLLAVPLFSPVPLTATGHNILGTMQIYYKENDKVFNQLDIILAELLARRISFVLAKKKIIDLQKLNRSKEAIINKIFIKLSHREGIKLKDLFILLIPELDEMLEVQGCTLFTVSDDQQYVHLVAAYPPDLSFHEANYSYTVVNHPYFQVAITGTGQQSDTEHERITSSYVLIKTPLKSSLVSDRLQELVKERHIHSILFIPLKVGEQVRHLLTFYATKQRKTFTDEEVELFTFFGKEIMKASKLEFLDDVLHDIKNPAIALAGFANRALKLLDRDNFEEVRPKLKNYLEVMASEASRMQDLAQAMSGSGREERLDLSSIVMQRFKILEEVVRSSNMHHVTLSEPELQDGLFVFCPKFGLERILDNLLGNAARACPEKGGNVAVRGTKNDQMINLVIENSGEIRSDQLDKVRQAEVKGRGLNIISKFVLANHGNMEIESEKGLTRFIIKLPIAD